MVDAMYWAGRIHLRRLLEDAGCHVVELSRRDELALTAFTRADCASICSRSFWR
ncbi:MAG: hypothetical protein R2911_01375 [Caldilineaceae bacterium]